MIHSCQKIIKRMVKCREFYLIIFYKIHENTSYSSLIISERILGLKVSRF